MRIREATLEDLPEIVSIEGLCFPDDTAFPPGMFSYLIRYAVTLVAQDGKILGFAIGYTSGGMGMIYTLDVHPKHRRKGVGSALMRALEDELKARGARRLKLEVAANNPGAEELYRRMGFSRSALIMSYYGRGKDAIRMIKDIAL